MRTHWLSFSAGLVIMLLMVGCGTTGDETKSTSDSGPPARFDEGQQATQANPSLDSLVAENRNLREQVAALAAENRTLTARITETEGVLQHGSGHSQTVPAPSPTERSSTQTDHALRERKTETSMSGKSVSYEAALAAFKKNDLAGAIEGFRGLLGKGIERNLVDNCHYWIGEAYYAQKSFDLASQEFENVLKISGADKTDDARLMLGSSYAALGKTEAARRVLSDLIRTSPNSPSAKRAKARLGQLK